MADYIVSTRKLYKEEFQNEPGKTRFLRIDNTDTPKPSDEIKRTDWFKQVRAESISRKNVMSGKDCGDILFFVHGFNHSPKSVLSQHRQLKKGLSAQGYMGAIVSFDWPSATSALNYLEDRTDAKLTAFKLVQDCIIPLSQVQTFDCEINVHVLAHSAGAYVVREAFDDADDRPRIAERSWTTSQIMFIAADISSSSLSENNPKSSSLFRHCVRLTNYNNPFDKVLTLSNVKRIGVAPRAGRIGLPSNFHVKSVNIDCGQHYQSIEDNLQIEGFKSHSWYFFDGTFYKDLFATILGDVDRHVVTTRTSISENFLSLKLDS